MDSDTLRCWRSRFAEQGTPGLGEIAKGRGRKPSLPAGTIEEVLRFFVGPSEPETDEGDGHLMETTAVRLEALGDPLNVGDGNFLGVCLPGQSP